MKNQYKYLTIYRCVKIIVFRVRDSRRHPVDQVKMFKKNCCHFEKNIKVANIYSKVPD
jgi:hypothetical protein